MALLDGKVAVIYGAGGALGGAFARAFAREGAMVVLAGRRPGPLERVAAEIVGAGGRAEVAPVDALDAEAVEKHAAAIEARQGKIDVAVNLVTIPVTQGAKLVDMPLGQFADAIAVALRAHFLTATAAGRRMIRRRAGVLLTVTAQPARKPYPNTGGFGVACAALEALYRQLAAELGPHGVRAVVLRSAGSPDAPGVDEALRVHAEVEGITREAFEARIAEATMLKRLPRMAEVAAAAVLAATDRASALTAAVLNVTCGELAD
jgi:NAD(P)-dependent dehydrogenase (short-subunit alcohol dehydrogenase family)